MKSPQSLKQISALEVEQEGRRLLYFGGCDYLRLSWHPKVRKAFTSAVNLHGLNASASRATSGNHPIYSELEEALARHFRVPTALVTGSGYTANLVAAQAAARWVDSILIDEKAHPALFDAAAVTGKPSQTFAHLDCRALETKMRGTKGRVLLLSDGLFSYDGAVPDLINYQGITRESDFMLIDDAHAAGIYGPDGRGTVCREPGMGWTITLSKALGVFGGAVLGSKRFIAAARGAPAFVGQTPMPIPCASGVLTALALLPELEAARLALWRRAADFRERLLPLGFGLKNIPSLIFPLVPQSSSHRNHLRERLLRAGIYPNYVTYHGAANGYFRVVLSIKHRQEHLNRLFQALA